MRLPWFQSSAMPLVMWTGILCLGACGVSLGQARIANGGFEASSGLPTSSGQFSLVDEWTNGGSDVAIPDYYHELGSDGGDLPQTPLAKVDPRSGRAVAGFVAYSDESNPRHEYLTGSFTEPLTVGQRYKMSFAITSGRVHDWVPAGIGVSGLGVVMTNSPPVPLSADSGKCAVVFLFWGWGRCFLGESSSGSSRNKAAVISSAVRT